MIYNKILEAKFISRPNRFIAYVEINSKIEKVHVKNTGRCRELLLPGARLILEDCSHNKNRKTKYSLIGVYKGDQLINMDSQVPNKVVYDALKSGKIAEIPDIQEVKREVVYKNSRFDLAFKSQGQKSFLEVKGVTLEEDGLAMFPDAPTERGTKHILELIDALEAGYRSYIFFLIQINGIKKFSPNKKMDPDFYRALKLASEKGVEILAYNSIVKEASIELGERLEIIL